MHAPMAKYKVDGKRNGTERHLQARQNAMYASSMYHGYGGGAGAATLAPMPSLSPSAPLPPFPVHPDVKFKK